MADTTISSGDQVFLEDGQICEYVAATHDGHVVRPMFNVEEDSEREPWRGEPRVVRCVFTNAPVGRYNAEIASLLKQIELETHRLEEAQKARVETERVGAARIRAWSKYPALERLDDFIEGRITHVVKVDYGPEILTFEDAFKDRSDSNRDPGLKLLWLYGGRNGPFWGLNDYKDGSGSSTTIIPCTSLVAAEEEAKRVIAEGFHAWSTERKHEWRLATLVSKAKEYGAPVPEEIALHVRRQLIAAAESNVSVREKELATAREKLAIVEADYPLKGDQEGG